MFFMNFENKSYFEEVNFSVSAPYKSGIYERWNSVESWKVNQIFNWEWSKKLDRFFNWDNSKKAW